MHLPTGPTAVYHHHHHHHHLNSQTPNSGGDWNFSGGIGKGSSGSSCGSISTLDPPTLTGDSSPPGSTTTTTSTSTSSSSQDLWWTERLILEAQQEFPGELGLFEFLFVLFDAEFTEKK